MNSAASQVPPPVEGRLHPRTHLFVIATLYSDAGSAPVHVRNMSRIGASIEGSALPEPGTPVTLRRGSLEAHGRMAWKIERKGGVALDGSVDISDWMAKLQGAQDRVDQLISDFRTNRPSAVRWQSKGETPASVELEQLRTELAQLAAALSADVIVVATHPEIQLIDIALQRVERLIARS